MLWAVLSGIALLIILALGFYAGKLLFMSKALKKHGFNFVGETICYAFMQAVGMVNDHEVGCHCYERTCELAIK